MQGNYIIHKTDAIGWSDKNYSKRKQNKANLFYAQILKFGTMIELYMKNIFKNIFSEIRLRGCPKILIMYEERFKFLKQKF